MVGSVALAHFANAALGVFLVLLALVVARLSLDRGTRAPLAAFLALVGLNYAFDGASSFLSAMGAPLAVSNVPRWLALGAAIADPFALLLFAVAATGLAITGRRAVLALAPATALILLLVLRPPGGPYMAGWSLRHVHVLSLVLCYTTAFVLLGSAYLRETRSLARDRLATLVVAFGVVTIPRLGLTLVDLGLVVSPRRPGPAVVLAMMAIPALAFGAAFLLALARAPAAHRPHVVRTSQDLLLLLVLVEGAWSLLLFPSLQEAGWGGMYSLRWLLFAAVFSAGMRRFELLSLPDAAARRVRLMLALLFVAVLVLYVAAILVAIPGIADRTALLAASLLVTLALVGARAIRRGVGDGPGETEWRRFAVYRAHVELGTAPDELARLRDRLGLAEREAREIEALVGMERLVAGPGARDVAEGQLFAGRYDVEGLVGVGSFGRTYLARDRLRGERVVLKELLEGWRGDAEALAAFRREAETALRVEHPNLVAFRGIERVADGHVLVLEHVEGETLRARLARGSLPPDAVARLASDLVAALGALHRAGIVHRDVKPENLVLRPDGRAVLLDFGAAASASGTRPASGAHPGTPAYMSPEQASGGAVGPASDTYAAAVVLWEALVGSLPPRGEVPPAWAEPLRAALSTLPAARPPLERLVVEAARAR